MNDGRLVGKLKPDEEEEAAAADGVAKAGLRLEEELAEGSSEMEEGGTRNPRPPYPPADESLVALPDLACQPSAAPRKGPEGALGYIGDCEDDCGWVLCEYEVGE